MRGSPEGSFLRSRWREQSAGAYRFLNYVVEAVVESRRSRRTSDRSHQVRRISCDARRTSIARNGLSSVSGRTSPRRARCGAAAGGRGRRGGARPVWRLLRPEGQRDCRRDGKSLERLITRAAATRRQDPSKCWVGPDTARPEPLPSRLRNPVSAALKSAMPTTTPRYPLVGRHRALRNDVIPACPELLGPEVAREDLVAGSRARAAAAARFRCGRWKKPARRAQQAEKLYTSSAAIERQDEEASSYGLRVLDRRHRRRGSS